MGDHLDREGNRFIDRMIDRRRALNGAAGALLGGVLSRQFQPIVRAAKSEAPGARFDSLLADQLQHTLEDVVAASSGAIPGAILHVNVPDNGNWSGAAGLGQIDPNVAMLADDHFPAGSIVKPFVAATVLQLIEDGRFALDSTLLDVLPADVTSRFTSSSEVTVRMLLGHRSGLPEWDTAAIDAEVATDPSRVWQETELLDFAAAQAPVFPPGTAYAYSNTNYTLLGLIIEHATNHTWRDEVIARVIRPLGLKTTTLPAPGNPDLGEPYAHGYMAVDGKLLDVTMIDPSMAGAAGGHSLATTTGDLVRFFDALLAGKLFQRLESLRAMLAFKRASDCPTCEPGQVGYGLALLQRVLPGGIETIDHLGGAGGYFAYVARLTRQQMTVALAMNSSADPSALILPVMGILANADLNGAPATAAPTR